MLFCDADRPRGLAAKRYVSRLEGYRKRIYWFDTRWSRTYLRLYIQSRIYWKREAICGRTNLSNSLIGAVVILQQALSQPEFLKLKSEVSQNEAYRFCSRNPIFTQLESFIVSDAFIQLSAVLYNGEYEVSRLSAAFSEKSQFYWALVAACYIGSMNLVECIISQQKPGKEIHREDVKGSARDVLSACLSMAASRGHRDLVEYLSHGFRDKDNAILCRSDFDPSIWGRHLQESCRNGCIEVTEFLLTEDEQVDMETACTLAFQRLACLTDIAPSYATTFGLVLDRIGPLEDSRLIGLLKNQLTMGTTQTVEILLTRLDCATLSDHHRYEIWRAATMRGPHFAIVLMRQKGFWCSKMQDQVAMAWRTVARTALRAGRTDIYQSFLNIVGETPKVLSIEDLIAVDGWLEVVQARLAEDPRALDAPLLRNIYRRLGDSGVRCSIVHFQAESLLFLLEREFGRSGNLTSIDINWQVRRVEEESYQSVLSTLRSFKSETPKIVL